MLVVELERVKQERHCSVENAAEILSTREPWNSFMEARESGDVPNRSLALKKQYNLFRKTIWATVHRDAFKYHVAIDTVDEWDQELINNWDKELIS